MSEDQTAFSSQLPSEVDPFQATPQKEQSPPQIQPHSRRLSSFDELQLLSLDGKESMKTILEETNPEESEEEIRRIRQEGRNSDLAEFIEDEMDFQIKNLDTGDVFDARNMNNNVSISEIDGNIFTILRQAGSEIEDTFFQTTISKGKSMTEENKWQHYWKKVARNNMLMLDYSEGGQIEQLRNLLDISNPIPCQIDFQGMDNWTALHFAAAMGHSEVVSLLLERRANICANSMMKRTALHAAVISNSLESVRILAVTGGVTLIDMQDKDFNTALHLASENNSLSICEILLQNGASQTLKNHKNLNAYELSCTQEMRECFAKADTNSQSSEYGRLCVGGRVQLNSRSDHVTKLLLLTQTAKKSAELRKADIFAEKQKLMKTLTWRDFKLIDRIGEGSFGEVWLVERDGQNYAMKVQLKSEVVYRKLQPYVSTEKRALSLFNHPFIIKLIFSFQNDHYIFLVMEFAEAGDMSKYLNKKGKLVEVEARIYTAQILLAIEELHKHHIIFRDLKPDNVVIDKEGNAKLTDFGLSKEGIAHNTLTKSFCGSIAYLPPEILTKRPHSRTVDWYLLGTFLYELLVGLPPYYDHERDVLYENIKKGPLKIPKAMSANAKDLIKQLLNRNPKERLGVKNDADDIKVHLFFEGLNWDDVKSGKIKNKPIELPIPVIGKIPEVKDFDVAPPLREGQKVRSTEQIKLENWTFVR